MPQASSNPYLDQVAAAAVKAGIDPRWAQATLLTENAPGNPSAVSSAGAQGLMQVLPTSAPGVSLSDPTTNIATGVAQLAANLKATGGDMSKASAMYFAGPSYQQWGPKTHAYVQKVADNYNSLGAPAVPATAPAQSPSQSLTQDFDAYVSKATNPPASSAQSNQSLTQDFDAYVAKNAPAPTAPILVGRGADGRTAQQVVAANTPAASAFAQGAQALGRIGTAAGQGAVQAFGTAPLGMAPQTVQGLRQVGIFPPAQGGGTTMQDINRAGAYIAAPAIDAVARGAGALFSGAQAGVAQAGAEVGQPQLGRDIAAVPEAFAGDIPGAAEETAGAAAADNDAKLAARPGGNTLVGAPAQENALTTPRAPEPTPASATPSATPATAAAPVPKSAGAAATPAAQTPMTKEEAASEDASDNLRRLTAAPVKGDATIYVPGSFPTAADVAGDAATSLEENAHRFNLGTETAQKFQDLDTSNNEARVDLLQSKAGNPNSTAVLDGVREGQREADLTQAFSNKTAADATPVVDDINQMLSGRAGKRSAVVKVLNEVRDNLYDAQGNLETDPEMLYGVRESIGDMLSAKGALANPGAQLASKELMQVKNKLDSVIEPAAPGFGQYLQNYANNSRPIDTQEYLQAAMPGMMNGGVLSQPKFHQFMTTLSKQRAAPGVNAAKSIDPDTMEALWNIHSDLQRTRNRSLGRATSSPTVQNASVLSGMAGHAGNAIAHTVAAHVLPVGGNMLLEGGKAVLKNRAAAKNQAALAQRTNELLHPPEVYGSVNNPLQ